MIARRLSILLLAAAGCSEGPQAPPEPPPAALRGTVKFAGRPMPRKRIRTGGLPGLPPEGIFRDDLVLDAESNVRWAFVYVKAGLEGRSFPPPSEPVMLYQTEYRYDPHVLGIQVAQAVEVRNLDQEDHSTHVNLGFCRGLVPRGHREILQFSHPELMVPVSCNIHPWMRAWVGVLDHPFFAVTDAEGKFEIGNLPAGKYTIGVWHERLAFPDQEVEVRSDRTMEFVGVLK